MVKLLTLRFTTVVFLAQAFGTDSFTQKVERQRQSITWEACDANLQNLADRPILCGNLSVPLDYTNLESRKQHTLELIRVPVENVTSKGSIIFNFGGPGAEGLTSLASAPSIFQNITGGEYDLVGFNPRGTSQNFLRFSCYDTEVAQRSATTLKDLLVHTDASDVALGRLWADGKVLADTCYNKMNTTGTLIGTVFTARDVMQVVDALGEGPLLNFYGFSYGTTLGATLAAMFPDRIGSMVLDGVLNSHEYYNAFTITEIVHDTDAAFDAYLAECVAAGPSLCALAAENMTASSLRNTLYDLFEKVRSDPIPFPAPLVNYDSLVAGSLLDYSGLKALVQATLYHPTFFGLMAAGIQGVMQGNLSAAALWRDTESVLSESAIQAESLRGIRCSDSFRRASKVDELIPTIEQAANLSRLGGHGVIHGLFGIPCASWRMEAKERYDGDFRVATKNPLLLIGNTYDPATPIISAHNMSAGFEGSVVLERAGFGHSSLSQWSTCAYRAVAEYFNNKTLPEPGTVCQPDEPLFSSDMV